MPAQDQTRGLRRALLLAAETLVVIYVALDAVFTPIFRPLIRWTAKLRLVIRLQEIVARLPPYGILALLTLPFAVAEPAKVYALFLMGTGHLKTGVIVMAAAYLVSLLVVERIYQAGRSKLRTIGWFAKLLDWLVLFRDQLLAWARATPAWIFASKLKQRARGVVRSLRLRLGLN
jgi:hypothetical protein